MHLYLTPIHVAEVPWLGALYVALAVACLVLTAAAVRTDTALTWISVGTITLLALVGLLGSRTIDLPQIRDDIDHWDDPFATLTIVVEALTIMFTAATLRWWRTGEPAS